MASVLAIVSRAVFEELPVRKIGAVAALDRYKSSNAAFANLGADDAIFLVTVRDDDELRLVAVIDRPRRERGAYVGAINTTPITDITPLVRKLVLASGDGIRAKRGKLAMSLQTPRVLADADVALLRRAAPRARGPAPSAAIAMKMKRRTAKAATAADPSAPPPNTGGPIPKDVRALVEQVYAAPADRALRAVLADALLERHHVWGELISLQLDDPQKHRRRIAEIVKKHAADFVGPIIHLSRRDDLEVVDGFLDGCAATKTLAWEGVGRRQWTQAARAKEWATVTRVFLLPYVTPHWWIELWLRNPALANLRSIQIGNTRLDRASPGDPWQLSIARGSISPAGHLVTLLRALPHGELARIASPASAALRQALDRARAKPKPKRR